MSKGNVNLNWPSRRHQKDAIQAALEQHSNSVKPLFGIMDPRALEALTLQFIASIRREDYYRLIQRKEISPERADPNNRLFDAERAVAYHVQQKQIEEASWLVFLMTHFAKPADSGWTRLKDVYGKLGQGTWTWADVKSDPDSFVDWLRQNWRNIRGKFGNHRKYESLDPEANRNIGRVVRSYLAWVGEQGHQTLFANAIRSSGNDPHSIFDFLYSSISVVSFGRLAKFDYLALIGRYNIAPITPGSAYFKGATGPTRGAKLLFDGDPCSNTAREELQLAVSTLDSDLRVGMQVMEDALCNWQKSPMQFVHFKG